VLLRPESTGRHSEGARSQPAGTAHHPESRWLHQELSPREAGVDQQRVEDQAWQDLHGAVIGGAEMLRGHDEGGVGDIPDDGSEGLDGGAGM